VKRRLHLLCRALRRLHARCAYRQARARSQRIRDNYMLLGAELLSALRAEADANLRMTNANRQK